MQVKTCMATFKPPLKQNGIQNTRFGDTISPSIQTIQNITNTLCRRNRDWKAPELLNKVGDGIKRSLDGLKIFQVTEQNVPYSVGQPVPINYKNIIATYGPTDAPRIIIGAHYDVNGKSFPGADDNAGSVAALLELAKQIQLHKPQLRNIQVVLAFYTLEEQGFIGSEVHAKSLNNQPIKGMISLDMIGCYSDIPGTQTYPQVPGIDLAAKYGNKGNFLALLGSDAALGNSLKQQLDSQRITTHVLAPLTQDLGDGLRSDHKPFVNRRIPALMLTDTANFRRYDNLASTHYHTQQDTPELLNYPNIANTVTALYQWVTQM